jgi:hypothetical protein
MSQRERRKMIDYYAQALGVSGTFRKFQLDQLFPDEAEGHNLSAHHRFGKGRVTAAFAGDDVDSG